MEGISKYYNNYFTLEIHIQIDRIDKNDTTPF